MDIPGVVSAAFILAAGIIFASVIRTFGEGASPAGRFRFRAGANGQDQMLDTKSGRLWERVAGAPEWVPVTVPWHRPRGKS